MLFALNAVLALLKLDLAPFSSSLRVPAGDPLVTPETPIYGQLKVRNMENRHVEVAHDTHPMRVFESRVCRVLDRRLSLSGHPQFQLPFLAIWSLLSDRGHPPEPLVMPANPLVEAAVD